MRFLDLEPSGSTHYNVLVYGPAGSGKSSFGVSAPGPVLVCLSEMNGVHHIRDAAMRLKVPLPVIVFVDHTEVLEQVLASLYSDASKPFVVGKRELARPRSVVLDQLSDMGRMLLAEHDKRYPPKIGNDGLPTRARNSWNLFGDRYRKLIRSFRDAPCHSVFIAEQVEKMVGEEGSQQRYVGPVVPMQALTTALVHSVSVVGNTYRTYTSREDPITKNRIVEWGITTAGPQYQVTKVLRPLNDREVPDFGSWVRRLEGSTESVRLPEPPQEMKEGLDAAPAEPAAVPEKEETRDGIPT